MAGLAERRAAAHLAVAVVLVQGAHFAEELRGGSHDGFPEWVARHTKATFGTLFIAGLVIAAARWLTT